MLKARSQQVRGSKSNTQASSSAQGASELRGKGGSAVNKNESAWNTAYRDVVVAAKEKRRIQTAMKIVGLPFAKTIEEYDLKKMYEKEKNL